MPVSYGFIATEEFGLILGALVSLVGGCLATLVALAVYQRGRRDERWEAILFTVVAVVAFGLAANSIEFAISVASFKRSLAPGDLVLNALPYRKTLGPANLALAIVTIASVVVTVTSIAISTRRRTNRV